MRGDQVAAQLFQSRECLVVVACAGEQQADLALDMECALITLTGPR